VAQRQGTYAFPSIGNRPVADVQPEEMLAIMRSLWRSKPETTGRILQRIDPIPSCTSPAIIGESAHRPASAHDKCWGGAEQRRGSTPPVPHLLFLMRTMVFHRTSLSVDHGQRLA
jgi:hypothetical protein